MAVALSESNINNLEKLNVELKQSLAKWPNLLSELEKSLTDNTGKTFKANYPKGKDACTKIKTVVDILQGEKKEMNKVVTSVTTFITNQRKANK